MPRSRPSHPSDVVSPIGRRHNEAVTHVLAIDQGTSGTKAIVVDDCGRVVSVAEINLRPTYLPGGGVEQDPEALWDSVVEAGRRALAEAGVPVAAVALANQGETVLAWDRGTGRPLTPAVVWQDRRAESLCAAIAAANAVSADLTSANMTTADLIAAKTGLVLDPYFSAPKMAWLRANLTRDGVVTTTDTWLLHRLCGAFVTDVSTASRSLLLDLDAATWSADLLELFGLADEELPNLVSCDEMVGETTAFGAVSIPVAGLIVDQQAALLAESCLEPGAAKCTYGTGAFLLAQLGAKAARSGAGLTTSVAWRLRNVTSYCADGQVYTAASAVRWAVELGLVSAADQLDAVSATDSAGVLSVPALAGLAAPWWDAQATASFTGMTLSSGRGHLVRALLEGIAAQVACLADLVNQDLGQPLTRLRVDGGLTRSTVLMQAQADLARIPVEVYPSPHATALGAAACARLALDPTLEPAAVVGTWTPQHVYEPVWSDDRAADHLARWRRAAETRS
jgi:glycerol kinase